MWVFNSKEIHSHEDLHPDCVAFVYVITYEDGKKYLGKKIVRSLRRLPSTKKQLKIRKNYVRKEIKDLPFINYEGSLDNSACTSIVSKKILYQCSSKITATYIETALLVECDALFSDDYLNQNILGKFYDNALEGLIE